jgi:hypothetical protein
MAAYNILIAAQRDRLQLEVRHAEWLRVNQKTINAFWRKVEAIKSALPEVSIWGPTSSPAPCSGAKHHVSMGITARDLAGLKDPKLEMLITPFLDATESRSSDYPNLMNRDYTFEFQLPDGNVSVTISAYVAEENPTCRKILVERKSVTTLQEVYALSCEGDIIEADPVLPKIESTPAALDTDVPF